MAVVAVVFFFVEEIPGWSSIVIVATFGPIVLSAYLHVRFTIYRVTSERIEIETGWISRRINHVDLFRVKDIRLRVGIIDRIYGIGNIDVLSSDVSDPAICIRGIPYPRPLYDRLKKEVVLADRRRGVVHIES